jgi:D-xylose transport system permease protein
MAGILTIAIGVVFVLLLGEIDLSISYVSAVSGVLLALLLRDPTAIPGIGAIFSALGVTAPLPWYIAMLLALGTVTLIGLIQGLIITKFQLPSFVVTLAGFMVWSGVVLILIGGAGTVIIQDSVIIGVANYFLPDIAFLANGQITIDPELIEGAAFSINVSWILAFVVIVFYSLYRFSQIRARRKQGIQQTIPLNVTAIELLGVALFTTAVVFVANQDRGLPMIAIILFLLLFGFSFLATRTRFGRYVYAVGGNKEAARRAGINVDWVRVRVFMISSLMAGIGGVVLASRLRSVATDAGGGDLLLNSLAAAVIGGTSLFGGSGRVTNAFLGALVIATVANGMGLLGLSSGVKFVVTGLVLLAAVLVDAITRRTRTQSGIA